MMQQLQISTNDRSNTTVEVQNYNVMPDLTKNIEYFDGERGPDQALEWLNQLEPTVGALVLFTNLRSHLKGAAKYWFTSHPDVKDWSTFRTAFKKTFLFEKSTTDLWKEMDSRFQQNKENVSLYYHEKVYWCRRLELPFNELKERVVIGFWTRDLANYLLSRPNEDVDTLYQDILAYERVNAARRGRILEKSPVDR
ncbi:hypothetical protein Trydic_g13555 [Trypoxylus dichotomus]